MSGDAQLPDVPTGPIRIDKARALRVLEEEVALANAGGADAQWVARVEALRRACEGGSKTHIAALGTALLARATNIHAHPFSLKVKAGVPGAYSARSLVKDVLAAHASRLGIDLGVTGREPLNNQPYFRYDLISVEMDVKGNARATLELLCTILTKIGETRTEAEARAALRAFLKVSKRVVPAVRHRETDVDSGRDFVQALAGFVALDSEGGKRAQAVAAGLCDAVFGDSRVRMSRINDPDRRFPGDVAVLDSDGAGIERAIEVRDKPVTENDLRFMVEKCLEAGVAWAGILAVADGQPSLVFDGTATWATNRGVELIVFRGWESFVEQALFWGGEAPSTAIVQAHERVFARLLQAEVSERGLTSWNAIREGRSQA